MSKMTWKAFVPKKPNRRLIKKKTVITAVAGISAANDSTTVGGTPAGILITQPFFSTKA